MKPIFFQRIEVKLHLKSLGGLKKTWKVPSFLVRADLLEVPGLSLAVCTMMFDCVMSEVSF